MIRLGLSSTLIRRLRSPENGAFRKRSPEWIHSKTPFSCCSVDGKRSMRFRYEVSNENVFKRKRISVDVALVSHSISSFRNNLKSFIKEEIAVCQLLTTTHGSEINKTEFLLMLDHAVCSAYSSFQLYIVCPRIKITLSSMRRSL